MVDGDKILIGDQNDDQLRIQAEDFLKSGYFFAAMQFYKKLLEKEPDNKDFHIGFLMAQNNINNEDDLIKYYQDLYCADDYETVAIEDKEDSHIEEMAEKSYIPNYLEKDEIRKAYEFDLSYRSFLPCRKRQKEEILRLIEKDDHLSWLKRKGFNEISEIIRAYDRRIDQAETDDKNSIDRIRNEYQRFLYQAYTKVKDLNKKAKERKENDYKDLIDRYENSIDIEELRKLVISFENLGDYKQAKKYVSLCEEKVEDLKKQNEDDSLRKSVDKLIQKARTSLLRRRFGEAYDSFAKVVSLDDENEDGYLGILMAKARKSDVDELFEYYKSLYSEDRKERLEAVDEDERHIEEMAEKYYLPDFLEKETIRERYAFDRSYLSSLNNRLKQESLITEELEMNPVFMWLKENGSDETKKRIEDLYSVYQNRVVEAKEEDDRNIERIRNEYQRFLFKTYAEIKRLYNQANDQKDKEYQQIIRSYVLTENEDELNDMVSRLEALGAFKDSEKYISLITNRIKEIREKEDDIRLQQEIETTLIAGRSYLLAGNDDLANESFDKVLSLDNDNPHAYLGILMLETGTKNYDELIRYYQDLYTQDIAESVEGCPIDRDHIDQTAEKYHIPGYFEKDMIRRYYTFDRSFDSFTQSRIGQKKQLEEEFELNPLLQKISLRKDKEITDLFDRIFDAYDERIRLSRLSDQKQKNSIEHIYQIYLSETDRTIEKIYEEKLKERNDDLEQRYKENVDSFYQINDIEKLKDLIYRFEDDIEYKDNREYIDRCEEKIRQLRINEEKETLTSLSEEGREFLENRLYHQAREKFLSYLDIDPGDEDAHIGLLLAETQLSDLDSLSDYYQNLYFEDIKERIEIPDDMTDHIEEMVEKCHIPGLLEKEEIRDRYVFDRSYESSLKYRINEKAEIANEINLNPSLSWLKENGSSKTRDFIDGILNAYNDRIEECERSDQDKINEISKEYKNFIKEKDREVRSLYNSLLKQNKTDIKAKEKERKEAEFRQKEEAERERKRQEEKEKAELVSLENERKKQKEAEKEERRSLAEQAQLEKQAQKRLEKEKARQEKLEKKAEKALVEKAPFRPNIGIVAAVISLVIFAGVSYFYLYRPNNMYRNAMNLVEEGRYEEAVEIFTALGNYKDSEYQIKNTIYRKADDLYQKNDLISAITIFREVRFDDSEERVEEIRKELFDNAKIGSSVIFGVYEQDNDENNGSELIEWVVLDMEEDNLLLISKYGLDNQIYNEDGKDTNWRDSELRGWLNSIFLNNIADFNERNQIQSTRLENMPYEGQDLEYEELEQYSTVDKIFVLSGEEVDRYYPELEERMAFPTAYAIENGALTDNNNFCSWWLRSPGNGQDMVEYVWNRDGSVASSMESISHVVRPVMWLKID